MIDVNIVASSLIVLLGSFLLVISYYYLGLWYKKYLEYIAQKADRSQEFGRDFYSIFLVLQTSGHRLLPIVSASISYVFIGFGILATYREITETTDALLYSIILVALFAAFNIICLFFEMRRSAKKAIRLFRLILMNAIISFYFIMGNRLVTGDALEIVVPAAAFFIGVHLGIVIPGLRYIKNRAASQPQ